MWRFNRESEVAVARQARRVIAGRCVQYCLLFGFGDREPARWDGSIEASGARIWSVEIWYLGPEDRVEGNRWQLSTRRVVLTRQQTARNAPLFENGVYVQAEIFEQDPEFRVHTLQGEFRFRASEVLWGQTRDFLGGRARVERIPLTWQVSDWIEEEDFPAITGSSDRGTAPA